MTKIHILLQRKEDTQRQMKLGYSLLRYAYHRTNNCNQRQEKWTNSLEQMKEFKREAGINTCFTGLSFCCC